MENVFQVGDVVYHPTAGKGEVTSTDGRYVHFLSESSENVCATSNICSFAPWPEPNHIRPEPPIKNGWWLTQFKGCTIDEGFLRYVKDGRVFTSTERTGIYGYLGDYVFIRYLGHDWKKEQS